MLRQALALLLVAAAPPRDSLGQFGRWGAFREGGRCFALAEPLGRGGGSLAVAIDGAGRPKLHLRLAQPGAAVVQVDGRSFPLPARGTEAGARSSAVDLAILRAMRRGTVAEVRVGASRARYPLTGFASALDAALVGCAALAKSRASP
jgi:hypothetical protein